jgi:hypothetical protein
MSEESPAVAAVEINAPDIHAWRQQRYKFLASLVKSHLTGCPAVSWYPEGAQPVGLPPGLADHVQVILDKIKGLADEGKPLDPDFPRSDLYEQVYNLVRAFMSQAPGPVDQGGNHQVASLADSIDHVPQLSKLCQSFHMQCKANAPSTEAEHYRALGDVMYASQKQVLVQASMKANDFLPIAQLVREVLQLLVAFRQSQKPPVASPAAPS